MPFGHVDPCVHRAVVKLAGGVFWERIRLRGCDQCGGRFVAVGDRAEWGYRCFGRDLVDVGL